MSIMCWIGLARKFQNQTEPFSLRRTCAGERGYHTRGVSACWASLWKQRFRSESRPPCGGIVESAPEAAPVHSQRARTAGFAVRVNSCFLTDRPRLATKVDDGGGNDQFLLAVVDWLPTLERGRPTKSLILSMDDCKVFNQRSRR
jgi:hypothetical protein